MMFLRYICANLILLSFIALITGCAEEETLQSTGSTTDKPPEAFIEINNEMYETTLGTYCWDGGGESICSDTAGPIELLEREKPIKVKPGTNITFMINYEPKPNNFHVVQISDNKETEVAVKDNRFSAPTQKGIYYYSYGVWWMDETRENVSNGDAFYYFVLDVD